MLGIFASKAINPNGVDGLIYGGTDFFFKELAAIAISSVYAFVFTYAMLVGINKITKVKVSEEEEIMGLDSALHGERARDMTKY